MTDVTDLPVQQLSDTIEVVLLVTAPEVDTQVSVSAFTDNPHTGSAEDQARSRLGYTSSKASADHQRCAGMVRVRIPRELLRERWQRATP